MSTACPICCLRWLAPSTTVPGRPRRSGSRLIAVFDVPLDGVEHGPRKLLRHSLPDRAAFDERRAVDGFDGDVPPVARDPFGVILKARRMPGLGTRQTGRHHRGDRRAVDEHAGGDDEVLVDRPIAVVKARLVLAEQYEVVVARDLDDDRAAEGAFGIAGALACAPVILQRRRQARGGEQQRHGDDGGNDVTYHLSVTLGIPRLDRAYAACEALARSHYENFPVASRLLPAAMRPHVAAVYAFARVADDIADEGTTPAAERLERLGAWQQRLHAAIAIEPSAAGSEDDLDGLLVR